MRITTKTVASAALITALAVGAAVPAAFAQATEQPSDASSEVTPEERHAEAREELAAALAEELGIDVERVSAAIEEVETTMAEERRAEHVKALEERLDAAVADGSLTREQADAILEAKRSGALSRLGGRGHHRGFGGHGGMGFAPPTADSSAETGAAAPTGT